jgi:alkylation response protein AidB-like acyl-CoA dehydrogenase
VQFEQVRVEPEWVVPFQVSFERATTIGPLAQIIHAAIDLGQARGAFDAAVQFVRERSRPWIDAKVERAADDPLTIAQFGDLAVRLRAAEALLRRAGRFVDAAQAHSTDRSVAEASVAVAEARALTTTVSLDAGSRLFELAGTAATLDGLGLDRFWRNARTHTLHDPVRWKYHAVGNFYLNDKLPPRHGAL